MIQNIKKKNTTCSNNIAQNIQANIYYLHFNKNFITLDLKMQRFEAASGSQRAECSIYPLSYERNYL